MRRMTCYSLISAASLIPLTALATMPDIKQESGMRYVSGGFGKQGREQLQKIADGFDVRAVFTEQNGKYTSYVDVTVTTPDGEPVLTTTSKGPVMLLDLPEGSYMVKAEQDGEVRKARVRAHQGQPLRTIHLNW